VKLSARELQTAIDHFKSKDGIIDKATPVGFVSPDECKAMTDGAKLRRWMTPAQGSYPNALTHGSAVA
jgi:hypothetical protein